MMYYSKRYPDQQEQEKTTFQALLYYLLYKTDDERVNQFDLLREEDVKAIFSSLGFASNYIFESDFIESGIHYTVLALGGVKAEYRNKSAEQVAHDLLTAYRQHWRITRGYDIFPFIPLLTPRRIVFAVPVSKLGFRTLVGIQHKRLELARQIMDMQTAEQERYAKAMQAYKNKKQ